MNTSETYTIEAAVALLIIALARKLYYSHCKLEIDDSDEEKE